MNNLYVFWEYDFFPYLRYGKMGETLSDGRVKPENSGGYSYKPLFFLPEEIATKLINELEELKEKKEAEEQELYQSHKDRLKKILDTYPTGQSFNKR